MTSHPRWTAEEDEIVRTKSLSNAVERLRSRTKGAITERRTKVGALIRSGHRPWTAEEDGIVRTNSIKGAVRLLSSHTEQAIKQRRYVIGAIMEKNKWTAVEDRRIRKSASLPIKKVVKLFRNRTAAAISTRRTRLGCQRSRSRKPQPWTGTEIKLLSKMWSACETTDLVKALPRHTLLSIRSMANTKLRLKKAKTFDTASLYEAIKSRAREDGISLVNLATESGCGLHILRRRRPGAPDNFNKIAKAVDFFGGRLMIDWCDE